MRSIDDLTAHLTDIEFNAVSPLALNKTSFPKTLTVLDSSIASSSATFAVHASSSSETIFLTGANIVSYLQQLQTDENKLHEIDFEALKSDAPMATAAPAKAATTDKESAKIEGAVQIAIGVKKELDFAAWYTNVSIGQSI